MPPTEIFTPAQAATLIGGVDASSIRRWCGWHAAHLSPTANPSLGVQRQLSAQDVETLREVKRLRVAGLTTPAINAQLSGRTFAVVETPASAPAAQDGPGTELVPIPAQIDVQALTALLQGQQTQLDDLRASQRSGAVLFVLGVGLGVILCAALILIIIVLIRPG